MEQISKEQLTQLNTDKLDFAYVTKIDGNTTYFTFDVTEIIRGSIYMNAKKYLEKVAVIMCNSIDGIITYTEKKNIYATTEYIDVTCINLFDHQNEIEKIVIANSVFFCCIKEPSFELCKRVLNINSAFINYMPQTKEIIEYVLGLNIFAISHIKNQDDIDIKYLKKCAENRDCIQHIANLTEELWKHALDTNKTIFCAIKNKTAEMCEYAVNKNPYNIKFVPKEFLSYEMCKNCLTQIGYSIQYIPSDLLTDDMYQIAIDSSPIALEYIPADKQTVELCMKAVGKDYRVLLFVHNKTPEIINRAIEKHPNALQYVSKNDQTYELCLTAIDKNIDAIYHVKNTEMQKQMMKYISDKTNINNISKNTHGTKYKLIINDHAYDNIGTYVCHKNKTCIAIVDKQSFDSKLVTFEVLFEIIQNAQQNVEKTLHDFTYVSSYANGKLTIAITVNRTSGLPSLTETVIIDFDELANLTW